MSTALWKVEGAYFDKIASVRFGTGHGDLWRQFSGGLVHRFRLSNIPSLYLGLKRCGFHQVNRYICPFWGAGTRGGSSRRLVCVIRRRNRVSPLSSVQRQLLFPILLLLIWWLLLGASCPVPSARIFFPLNQPCMVYYTLGGRCRQLVQFDVSRL